MGARRSSCRVREQESKLTYRHAEPGTAKRKKKGYSSLLIVFFIFFVLRKGKEKNSFLYFLIPFHCNTSTLGPSSPTAENKLRENF